MPPPGPFTDDSSPYSAPCHGHPGRALRKRRARRLRRRAFRVPSSAPPPARPPGCPLQSLALWHRDAREAGAWVHAGESACGSRRPGSSLQPAIGGFRCHASLRSAFGAERIVVRSSGAQPHPVRLFLAIARRLCRSIPLTSYNKEKRPSMQTRPSDGRFSSWRCRAGTRGGLALRSETSCFQAPGRGKGFRRTSCTPLPRYRSAPLPFNSPHLHQ